MSRKREREHVSRSEIEPTRNRRGGDGGKDGGNRNRSGRKRRNRRRGGKQDNRNRRKRGDDRRKDDVGFWGDPKRLPPPESGIRITDDPAAVPRSLGPPPLPGHETIAENYFAVVYDRAIATAGALAAAGGMIDAETLAEELAD
jgi:hypothetical protein